ncbi:alpha/beta fold hydrolase [Streptosporangium sp. CA-135522]|uniref:alpha/beta fold hydrolase n=1 Tax=Streptosporangium sp. CA-135522 TaxID=3240072 RepID=UPI003D8F625F
MKGEPPPPHPLPSDPVPDPVPDHRAAVPDPDPVPDHRTAVPVSSVPLPAVPLPSVSATSESAVSNFDPAATAPTAVSNVASVEARSTGSRLPALTRRLAGGVLLPVAAVVAAVSGGAAFFGGAAVTAVIPLLCAAALGATLVTGFPLILLALGLLGIRRRSPVAAGLAGSIALAVAATAAFTVFRPMPRIPLAPPPVGVAFWDLPTGSRIAYVAVRAAHPRATPVIFLHGGPGTPGEGVPDAGRALAALGFDVYAYDQVGAGRSTRLADVTGYTVARQVADLEAIRHLLGADKLILVGRSWGGSLTARYLAAHPEHVAKAVFVSPGPLWEGAYPGHDTGDPWSRLPPSQTRLRDELAGTPRMIVHSVLMSVDPNAAHALVPDDEADPWFRRVMLTGKDATRCPGSPPAPVHDNRPGFYVNQLTSADAERAADPRPALRAVEVPVLILRGECDYLKPEVAEDYRRTLRGSTLVRLAGAGHSITTEQPRYLPLLRDFLLR